MKISKENSWIQLDTAPNAEALNFGITGFHIVVASIDVSIRKLKVNTPYEVICLRGKYSLKVKTPDSEGWYSVIQPNSGGSALVVSYTRLVSEATAKSKAKWEWKDWTANLNFEGIDSQHKLKPENLGIEKNTGKLVRFFTPEEIKVHKAYLAAKKAKVKAKATDAMSTSSIEDLF